VALEVLGSAIPPHAWTEPRMVPIFPDRILWGLDAPQDRPSPWTRLRREMQRLALPMLEQAITSDDELIRIQACRILIKSGLRSPTIDDLLLRPRANESEAAGAWRRMAAAGCGLSAGALYERLAPRGSPALPVPTEALPRNRVQAELDALFTARERAPAERMAGVEFLAGFVPRDLARDSEPAFLGRPLIEVQAALAETVFDCALRWMTDAVWGPPYRELEDLRRHAHVLAPAIAAEWLIAQENLHGGMDEAVWESLGPLLAELGDEGAGFLALGAEVQWIGVDEHVDWCCSNATAARMLVPVLPALWRSQLQPWSPWRLRQTAWDDWSNPLAPTFTPRESWTSKLVRAAGPEAAVFLAPSLDDPVALVRRRACQAFEALAFADGAATARIVALCDDEDVWVRFFAAKALLAIEQEGSELRQKAVDVLRGY
jgi:hypothetical protein